MKKRILYIGLAALAGLLILTVGLTRAQEPNPDDAPPPQSPLSIEAVLNSKISYQGVLKENGDPINGNRDMTFRLYSDDACTTQVGSDIVKSGVAVTNGLFSVDLEVTQGDFNGQGLWLEVEIGGTKIGCQEILAAPYALSLRPGATMIDDTSTARVNAFTSGPPPFFFSSKYGVYGKAEGTGVLTSYYGVYGSGSTAGVRGSTTSADGAGVYATGSEASGTALRLANGGIRVNGAGPGTDTPVFVHEATAGNIYCGFNQCTKIDHPLTNGDPDAILIVTQNYNPSGEPGVYNAHPIGVWYDGSNWGIFNEDLAAMPAGASFNVLVVKK